LVLEFIVTGIALAMDASAVSISDGMYDCKMNYKRSIFIALVFGVFQGLMPIIGYYAGRLVAGFSFMEDISNYLIFGIFVFLGANMIYESTKKDEEVVSKLTVGKILLQGVATSIDALFIGVSFALILDVNIYQAALIIAFITFVFWNYLLYRKI
jgi:putative Mn2+ efflux pump MntP